MPSRFDDDDAPDLKVVVGQYKDVVSQRMKWLGPLLGGVALLLIALTGFYSVNPGEVGVVRTFGKETGQSQPGLHFAMPIVQSVDIVDLAKVRRAEVGFRSLEGGGSKRVDSEALMLTGDENIIEAQMIVQYQIHDPSKFLFKLNDPEQSLHIAAEVALRGVVGQMRITASIDELAPSNNPAVEEEPDAAEPEAVEPEAVEPEAAAGGGAPDAEEKKAPEKTPEKAPAPVDGATKDGRPGYDPERDILTKGRERAQILCKERLQELMDLYESGLRITEVKLQVVDAPDEVKDAFHDVVRAREEREQTINKALGYREDRIPRARGQAQKIIQKAEAYRQERVLRAEGEANRFRAILAEYEKAKGVTRERLYLETMERILGNIPKKVFIDESVAKNALPFLPINSQGTVPAPGGNQ
ncbi:MAG: FtsH protease activity modulator HflK [Myxococcales bacterium]|nr:FtsH protease activity modulator HflK [Myxococcales bacterium]